MKTSKEIIFSFDVGKSTGWAFAQKKKKWTIRSGSGNPFEASLKLQEKTKNASKIVLLFFADESFLNGKTTRALERYKDIVLGSLIWKKKDIRIIIFNEATISREFLAPLTKWKNKKEEVLKKCNNVYNLFPKNDDEGDALMLMIWFLKKIKIYLN